MGEILQFTKKKIAFFGEVTDEMGQIIHTPYMYKICAPDTGGEICPRLFTIERLEDLPEDDIWMNRAIGCMYIEFYSYFSTFLDDHRADTFKAYAVSLEDNRILYSLILTNSDWAGSEIFGEHALPARIINEEGLPQEPKATRGNSVYIVGGILQGDGEIYNPAVVRKISNAVTNRVMFPRLFSLRSMDEFTARKDADEIVSCLTQCLIAEAEKMGAKSWIAKGDNHYQSVSLSFIDRETGRVLFVLNAIHSSEEGNFLFPEDWDSLVAYSKYFDLENAKYVELNVDFED